MPGSLARRRSTASYAPRYRTRRPRRPFLVASGAELKDLSLCFMPRAGNPSAVWA